MGKAYKCGLCGGYFDNRPIPLKRYVVIGTRLQPCPFAKLDEKHHIDVIETHPGYGYIYCRNCDFDFPSEESIPLDVLIERWNTRVERTCHPVEKFSEDSPFPVMVCSECGRPLHYDEFREMDYQPYCGCGAKVVE